MSRQGVKEEKKLFRKPTRIFEKSGLVVPESSYYVPLENVVNTYKQDIKTMVDQGRYFSIFAPRQSGKTTFLGGICRYLHIDSTYVAILLSFERFSGLDKKQFYELIEEELYHQLVKRLREVKCEKVDQVEQFLNSHHLTDHISFGKLFAGLNQIVRFKKVVIFIDEFDGIPLGELADFLTALRDLYQKYKAVTRKALYSIGIMGIRNITKLVVGGVSPFNIADHVSLPPFSFNNVQDLYSQYTAETNQPFSREAVKLIYEETSGQPWLVNRLGTILTVEVKPGTTEPINTRDVKEAVQILLRERNDHFDNLYEKAKLYKEAFVEIVFRKLEYAPDDEDQTWLEQYGLITEKEGHALVANNIYKARYLKTFFREVKANRNIPPQEYELDDGSLNMERILMDFEQYITQIGVSAFYRQWYDSSENQEEMPYERAGQFLLTAWLYQFVTGGTGELRYEVVSGLGRMDVLLTYKGRKYIIETKMNRRNLSRIIAEGVTQVSGKYLASESAHEGYVLVFDTKTIAGEEIEPIYHEIGDKKITCIIIAIGRPIKKKKLISK